MLVSSSTPNNLWGEAILFLYKKNGKTSYELWKGYTPNLKYLKVWLQKCTSVWL